MSVRFRLGAVGLLAVSIVVLFAPAALGCTEVGPSSFQQVLIDEDLVGVYEQKLIVASPALLPLGPRSASVVTRYWGVPPPDLTIQIHGDGVLFPFGPPCSQGVGRMGDVSYNSVTEVMLENDLGRRRVLPTIYIGDSFGSRTELSTDQEEELAARFGPPVRVDVSAWDRVRGTVGVWRHHMALAPAALLAMALLIPPWRRRSRYRFNRASIGLAVYLVMVALITGGSGFGYFGMWTAVLFALSVGLARISRSVVAVLAAGMSVDLLANAVFEQPSELLVGGMMITAFAAGVIAWSGRHWSRWPAGFAVVVGLLVVVHSWQGSLNPLVFVAAAVTGGVVWWTAFYYPARWMQIEPDESLADPVAAGAGSLPGDA